MQLGAGGGALAFRPRPLLRRVGGPGRLDMGKNVWYRNQDSLFLPFFFQIRL